MDKHELRLGPQIRKTNNAIRNYVDSECDKKLSVRLTGIEGMTVGYLFSKDGEPVSPADLMSIFSLKKATVSEACARLYKKGFVSFVADPSDKRKKRYKLTEKGKKAHIDFETVFDGITDSLEKGITEDEKKAFLKVCAKIRDNAGGEGND